MKDIILIDAGTGNLRSVQKALENVGANVERTDDSQKVLSGKRVVLPGVGAFGDFMSGLRARGLEDVALALGQAFDKALGDRKGIVRMGDCFAPMDETLAHVAVDLSGRPYAVIQADWHTPYVGNIPTTLFPHFFESFAVTSRCNLHARVLYGRDDHHQAEALFKAWARALDAASQFDERRAGSIPSTKGSL